MTLDQVATAWARDNIRKPGRSTLQKRRVKGSKEYINILVRAVRNGELRTVNPVGKLRRKDLVKIQISVHELKRWMQATNRRPRFLYPSPIEFSAATTNSSMHSNFTQIFKAPDPSQTSAQKKNVGGRPQKHDWSAMLRQIVVIAETQGLPKKSVLISKLEPWRELSDPDGGPSDASIYAQIQPIYDELKKLGWEPKSKTIDQNASNPVKTSRRK